MLLVTFSTAIPPTNVYYEPAFLCFREYGMLRYLPCKGIRIAVNWYLTENENSNNGNKITYLKKETERKKDPELFDLLKHLVDNDHRSVRFIEESKLLGDTIFFHDTLDVSDCDSVDKRVAKRALWHQKALYSCAGRDLVFLDPDNGIKERTTQGLNKAIKHVFTDEVADYYNRGQNVVYYCSKDRRTDEPWKAYKRIMLNLLPEAKLLAVTFHGSTQRTYVFVIHPQDYELYQQTLLSFCNSPWKSGNNCFTMEPISD